MVVDRWSWNWVDKSERRTAVGLWFLLVIREAFSALEIDGIALQVMGPSCQ
jgi:hypothetical protein